MPHLALPTLTAYLRGKGFTVTQRDLNIEVYDHFLSKGRLEASLTWVRQEYGPFASRKSERKPTLDRGTVQWALAHGPSLVNQVENAKAVFRSPAFYDGEASREAFLILAQSLQLASLRFSPSNLDWNTFTSAYSVARSDTLAQAVRDPETNPFLEFFRNGVIKDIERDQPDIVGISIPTQGQMLAAMTLAYLVKKAGLKSHVTVGGPHITMLRDQLPKAPKVFNWIDSAVVMNGEVPLLKLTEALEGSGDLSQVPNLIYKETARNGTVKIRVNQISPHLGPAYEKQDGASDETLDDLPDFDGLPLHLYLAPDRVLPLLTAHGCYHGKCAFCSVGYGYSNTYRQLPADKIVNQMMALHQKYGTRHIFFADEAITPRNLRHMSAQLEAKGSPINWCGCVRLDKPMTKDLLRQIAAGGGRMLLYGLETASEPIVKAMVKDTEVNIMARILEEGAQLGIWNHTFFFFGFPGETLEDAQETVNFIYAHKNAIHSASPGIFLLERYAPAQMYPDHYNVKKIIEKPEEDLAIYFDYEVTKGMDEVMADKVVNSLLNVIPQKRYGQYYITDPYRLLYSSYLRSQEKSLPAWLVPEG